MLYNSVLTFTAALASLALAKTDISGCTTTVAGGSTTWYVPGSGEICAFLDCGGGRAPPKTDVPGCADYSGTSTYSPSYLPGFTGGSSATSAAAAAATATSSSVSVPGSDTTTWAASDTSTSIWDLYTNTATSPALTTSSWSTITPAPGAMNQTTTAVAVPSAAANGTLTSATLRQSTSASGSGSRASGSAVSSSNNTAGAIETARAWFGGMGVIGIGAMVVAF